jgi:NADPH:quinone reductase
VTAFEDSSGDSAAAAAPLVTITAWEAQRERERRILGQAATHFDAGELHVVVGATYPLAQAADAHRALEAGQITGKAVLTMS